MENKVSQAQEVMNDEEIAGMGLRPYPLQNKKRREKSTAKKEPTKKTKGQKSEGTQLKIMQWTPDYQAAPQ